VRRNAGLSVKSNQAQKIFVDAAHVAAVGSSVSAEAQKKAKQRLDDAYVAQAGAEVSLDAAHADAQRLARIVAVRRIERDSQKAASEAAEAARALHVAMYDVAQKETRVELSKEDANRDASIASLQATFDAAELKAANARKIALQIKADAMADGIRLEAISAATDRVRVVNTIPSATAFELADGEVRMYGTDSSGATATGVGTDGVQSTAAAAVLGVAARAATSDAPSTTSARNAVASMGSASVSASATPDGVHRFLKTFNLLMMGDGTDKSIVMSMCNRMLQPEKRTGPWASFPMRTEEFPRNMRPYICKEGFGAGSQCMLAPEQSCCAEGGAECCMEGSVGNAAMHCANPGNSHTHVGLANHFGLSGDASLIFDADVMNETQGFDLPFSTGAQP